MEWKLELVVVPVTDVDRAKAFYVDRFGFAVDVDTSPAPGIRVVQMTPPGSACSVTIGEGLGDGMPPGSLQGVHLVVGDIEAARAELIARGAEPSEPFHFGPTGQIEGVHPTRDKYGSFMTITDPDGNGWMIQEVPPEPDGAA